MAVGAYILSASATDERGAISSSASVSVVVRPFPILQLSDIGLRADAFTFSFATESNWIYRVEYSEDLHGWITLVSGVPGTDAAVTTIDPAGASRPKRFYRVTEL